MQTTLVTNGAGFIGSHVVERLVGADHRVINLDLLTYTGCLENVAALGGHERHCFVHGDIADRRLVSDLLSRHRPATILNIAAETHVDRSIDNAASFIETKVTGVFRLLEAALAYWRALSGDERNRLRFVQMSTDEVYGSIADGEFTEESNYAPNSPYVASKAAGDHMVRAYGVTFDLPVVLVHASIAYGPRQYPEKLIPHMVGCALKGQPLPVYGQGINVRDWMHMSDLVRGLERVVERGEPGQTYNFAGRDEHSNIEIVRLICDHLDRVRAGPRSHQSNIAFVTDRPGHATIDWYLDNGPWWQSVMDRGYGGTRIGLGVE